ncbi:MAG: hypothetical protein M3336_04360 [Chloroflexota bacterium]|nr:hypothetical protein [Chloroflexota bacterium]
MRERILVMVGAPLLIAVLLTSCGDETGPTAALAADRANPSAQLASDSGVSDERRNQHFQRDFNLERCTFASRGVNPYFKLQPGYTLVLAGEEEGRRMRERVRVLDQTEQVNGVTTRVVEERGWEDGELAEVSRNFFAICEQNNSVFYFGEESVHYENGRIVSRTGWRAGVNDARAGLMMPGLPLLGARYFQEIAPGVEMDRAEIVDVNGVVRTPLRTFRGVLITKATTPLEPGEVDPESYAPDVGLIRDGSLLLVRFGFNVN